LLARGSQLRLRNPSFIKPVRKRRRRKVEHWPMTSPVAISSAANSVVVPWRL
jgi:hypothetical protein